MNFTDEKSWEYARRDAKIMEDERAKRYNRSISRGVLCDPFGEHGTTYDKSVSASISNARHVLGV